MSPRYPHLSRLDLAAAIPDGDLRISVPDGPDGTRETLKHMRQLVRQDKDKTEIRHIAVTAIAGVPGKAWMMELQALLDFVRANVRYTLDTNGIEVLQSPEVTLNLGYGDCDDMATLLAALCEAAGYETAFDAVGFDAPGEYSHVLLLAKDPDTGDLVALDATEQEPAGWFPPGVTCEMIAPIG